MDWRNFSEGNIYYGPQWRRFGDEIVGEFHWKVWIPKTHDEIKKAIVRNFGPLVYKKVRLSEEDLDQKILKIALKSDNFYFGNIDKRRLIVVENIFEGNIYGCVRTEEYIACPEGSVVTWDFFRKRLFQNNVEISLGDIIEAQPSKPTFYLFASAIADKLKPYIEIRKRKEMITVFGKLYKYIIKINHRVFLGYVISFITNSKRYAFNMIVGESLRVLLNQISLDEILNLTEEFSVLKNSNSTNQYVIRKLSKVSEKIDKRKLSNDLAEEGIPDYEFIFSLGKYKKFSIIYSLSMVFGFITEKFYWRNVQQIVRILPIINLIYQRVNSENPLLYREVLKRIGIDVDTLDIARAGKVLDYDIHYLRYISHIERFLKENLNRSEYDFEKWYCRGKILSRGTKRELRKHFIKYKRVIEDLRNYNIDKLVKDVEGYIKNSDWDEEIRKILK